VPQSNTLRSEFARVPAEEHSRSALWEGPQPRRVNLLRVVTGLTLAAFCGLTLAHLLFGVDVYAFVESVPACLFRWATGIDCPGCGMTRSFVHCAQLEPVEALRMHPAGPFLLAALALYTFAPGHRLLAWLRDRAGLLLIAVLALWVLRLAA